MSYQLPEHSPWWARVLGLRIDWRSRPNDPQRIYHNPQRTVEVAIGKGVSPFALQVQRYDEHTNLHVAIPRVSLHWRIAKGGDVPIGEMAVCWGAYFYQWESLVLEWGAWNCRIALNPFRWESFTSERLRADGEWDATPTYKPEAKEIEWYVEQHPYRICARPRYYPNHHEGPRFSNIEVWDALATCYVERHTRTRRWLPFWKRVEFCVYFDLSQEVGERTGSWKGGTVGFSEQLWPGDTVAEVVERAAQKSRGL